jgi:hypothetical protein
MPAYCLDCNMELQGRRDKKFCSDLCRVNFHNQKNRDVNIRLNQVLRALKKNRQILASFIEAGADEMLFSELLSSGYQASYHTHTEKVGERMVFFCFDYGYTRIDSDNIFLVKGK